MFGVPALHVGENNVLKNMTKFFALLLCLSSMIHSATADDLETTNYKPKTHTFHFTAGWVKANPDYKHEKRMIGFNGQWPCPDIHVNKGDRVELYLTNGFPEEENINTSLHFHGLFHNVSLGNSNQMDGPEMVTQCPIPSGETYLYNFTTDDQVGTYWYHSHSGAQYLDGLRGAFVIHDPEMESKEWRVDEEYVIQVNEQYYKPYYEIVDHFLSRYNPTGAEPVPQNFLFNNTLNGTLNFDYEKRYLLRFINSGVFVSQFIYSKEHVFTMVEVDGVYIKPENTHLIEVAPGQRVSVLVDSLSKDQVDSKYYPIFQIADKTMLDTIPDDLEIIKRNCILYPDQKWPSNFPKPQENELPQLLMNDFKLTTLEKQEILPSPDYKIELNVVMDNLGDGVNYAFFNNITYTAPKVPTLFTAITAPEELLFEPSIYGDNINAFVLQKNEVIEVVINNEDDNRHNFHLHGHNFQIVQKSKGFEDPTPFNESAPLMDYPEHPMVRDTVFVEANGHTVLRFKADNPGIWFFHCHIDFHLEQGLSAVFIEAPDEIQKYEGSVNSDMKRICKAANIPTKGNAAGNFNDWFDLKGLGKQAAPLPAGFTLKGYFALAVSIMTAIYGMYTITQYGLDDHIMTIEKEQEMLDTLTALVGATDSSSITSSGLHSNNSGFTEQTTPLISDDRSAL
ncbi:hypothetical protein ACO0QE_003508 [Hanseniaspora vineae]